MFIIIEGPDGAGKSILAKQLSKMTGFEIIKRDKPKNDEEKKQMFNEYVQLIMHSNNKIFDRFAHSELVYGPIMRDEYNLKEEQVEYLESLLAVKGAVIIHCTDSIDKLWQRCKTRGEDYITDKSTLERIRQGYNTMFNKKRIIPVLNYTINEENM